MLVRWQENTAPTDTFCKLFSLPAWFLALHYEVDESNVLGACNHRGDDYGWLCERLRYLYWANSPERILSRRLSRTK